MEVDVFEGKKIGFALPITNAMAFNVFWLSFILMDKPNEYHLFLPRTPVHEHADSIASIRNDLIRQALEIDCTHVLMIDTDQEFPRDTLTKLLSHNLPIVGAVVHRRYPPYDGILLRGEIGRMQDIPYDEWIKTPLIEVDSKGGGCNLFDVNIFHDIPYPWFRHIPRSERRPRMGEDMFLFYQLKKAGYKIYVDTTIDIDHLTPAFAINRNFYELTQLCLKHQQMLIEKAKEEQQEV